MSRESIIESATKFMEDVANDNSHGYSQINRWGPDDYDCSGLSITAWQQAGVPVKTKGATYTGNMYGVFKKCGFKDVTSTINLKTGAGLKRGDVLLNRKHHVAQYCGDGKEVEASINELGKATGGKTGDQTGKEILIRKYRNYPWTDVLRYEGNTSEEAAVIGKTYKADGAKNGIKYKITASSLMLRTDATTKAKIIKVLKRGTVVTWYGYYRYDGKNKWIYVLTSDGKTGWSCVSENGKIYMVIIEEAK